MVEAAILNSRISTLIKRFDGRTKRVLLIAASSYLGRLGQALVLLYTVPLAKVSLNDQLFGIWMMLAAMTTFMAFADLGIGNALLNHVTKARAASKGDALSRVLTTGYLMAICLGTFVAIIWLIWKYFNDDPSALVGAIPNSLKEEVLEALTIFALLLAINIPASLVLRIQLGAQQGYLNGLNQLCAAGLTLIAVFTLSRIPLRVPTLILATFGVQVAVNILNTAIWLACNGQTSLSKTHYDHSIAKSLLKNGTLFFLLQLSAAFAIQSDAIVITHTVGQAAYGDFAVTQRLFMVVSTFIGGITIGLWPAFGDAMARGQGDWAKAALRRSIISAALICIISATALSAAIPLLFSTWMMRTLEPDWPLIFLIASWTVIEGTANVAASFLNGANAIRAQVYIALTMAVASFAGKWYLTPIFGPAGSVASTIIAYCAIAVPGQIAIFRVLFKRDFR